MQGFVPTKSGGTLPLSGLPKICVLYSRYCFGYAVKENAIIKATVEHLGVACAPTLGPLRHLKAAGHVNLHTVLLPVLYSAFYYARVTDLSRKQ